MKRRNESIQYLENNADATFLQMKRGLKWKPFIRMYPRIRFIISPIGTNPITITAVSDGSQDKFRQQFPECWRGLAGKRLQNKVNADIGKRTSVIYCNHSGTQMMIKKLIDVSRVMTYVTKNTRS